MTTTTIQKVLKTKRNISSTSEHLKLIQSGIKRSTAKGVGKLLGLTNVELATILNIGENTLYRSPDVVLKPNETDHVISLAEIVVEGSEVFAHIEDFHQWLHEDHILLGGLSPVDIMASSKGCETVKQILGRFKHGIVS